MGPAGPRSKAAEGEQVQEGVGVPGLGHGTGSRIFQEGQQAAASRLLFPHWPSLVLGGSRQAACGRKAGSVCP